MTCQLSPGQSVTFVTDARIRYSTGTLEVKPGEAYSFHCPPGQKWKDWFYWSGPDGYFNLLARLIGTRVKGTKCFCLCGVFDREESTGFAIGTGHTLHMQNTGTLSFFANDSWCAYWNNSGSVHMQITRL